MNVKKFWRAFAFVWDNIPQSVFFSKLIDIQTGNVGRAQTSSQGVQLDLKRGCCGLRGICLHPEAPVTPGYCSTS